ncbi:MAG: ComEC/Rec2 family competence protein [Sulfurimonas sp.]|jgi:competence protein ComEC
MLEKLSLFNSKRDFFNFFLACGFVLIYTLLIEFQNYKNLTRFNSALVNATVVNQYTKTKESKTYQVLKLKSDNGFTFYTSVHKAFPHAMDKELRLEIFTDKITFYGYLAGFYASSKVLNINQDETLKEKINNFIASQHTNQEMANIYQALFLATTVDKNLQANFSVLGVSHIVAISGFHLAILSALLYFLLTKPYKILQNRYFPYRNSKSDLFIIIATILLFYMLFLDSPASLLRSYAMLIIGFLLYDRGFKIISMQTLGITIILLLVLFPRIFFSLGFWLSVAGVFYIFLFLIHFKHLSTLWQFLFIEFSTYLLMLPLALALFGAFGLYHPFSIILTMLFIAFYPLSILLHIIGFGSLLDGLLQNLIFLGEVKTIVPFGAGWLALHIALSFWAIFKKLGMWILLTYSCGIFIYAISYVL